MSGRPRTTSFAEGNKTGSTAPYGGMRTISRYRHQLQTEFGSSHNQHGDQVIFTSK